MDRPQPASSNLMGTSFAPARPRPRVTRVKLALASRHMSTNPIMCWIDLAETHNRLVAAILTHYRTLMMLATVQAEDDQESATPEATAVAGIAMKMEFDGLYSSVKELLTLSRKIKELWVFGALGQQDPSREARGAQIERDVAQAAEMLNGIEETRMRALAEGHGGTWRPLRREDVQALQALAGKQ